MINKLMKSKIIVLCSVLTIGLTLQACDTADNTIDTTDTTLDNNQTTPTPMANNDDVDEIDVGNTAGSETSVSIEDILSNPNNYIGKQVTVSSSIDDVYSDQVFVIEGPTALSRDLLIVSQTSVPNLEDELIGDDVYQVTGTVRAINVVEVEQEYDLDFDTEVEAELEASTLYIDATEVTQLDE